MPSQLQDVVPVSPAFADLAVQADVVEERQLDLQAVETAAEDQLAAAVAGAWADVDDPVRRGRCRRAYVLNVSTSCRCASVQIVSNTSDDLPLPLSG